MFFKDTIIMKKIVLCLILLLTVLGNITAQSTETSTPSPAPEELTFTRKDCLVYGMVPYATVYLVVAPQLFLPYDTSKYISASLLLAGGIPSVMIDPVPGLIYMGVGAAGIAGGFHLESTDENLAKTLLAGPLINIGQKTQMWSYYAGYQSARLLTPYGTYPDNSVFREETFLSLAKAPWDPNNLKEISVWIPLLVISGATAAIQAITTKGKRAVWKTGKAYLGQTEVSIPVGILVKLSIALLNYTFTAIGEEALFRGIGYEEMKTSWKQPWAYLADCTLFASVHVPYEYQSGIEPGQLLFKFSTRFGTTFFLDWAYDNGGLQTSTASHMWIDVISDMTNYLFTGGEPY